MRTILRDFNCTRGHIPVESIDAIQSIFNCSGDFTDLVFGHACTGGEAVEFFKILFGPATAEVKVYEIIHEDHIAKSVGVIAVQYAPEIRQSIFPLLLLDSQHRGLGIGHEALSMAEACLNPGSQYACAIVSLSNAKALNFWRSRGYLPETEFPMSINSKFFNQDTGYVRLVKESRNPLSLH